MKLYRILYYFMFLSAPVWAQDKTAFKVIAAGVEAQAYPAGFILGVRADGSVSKNFSLNLRAGYNFARRGDLGEHMKERGGGPGLSAGARYYLKPGFMGFFLGARIEFWLMDIDWEDRLPNDDIRSGNTDITVFQPLVEGGYTFGLGNGNWAITPKITLGYEINIKTKGEEVGQGAISLLGATFTKRI